MSDASSLTAQLVRYGYVAIVSYGTLLFGTYALHEWAHMDAAYAYAITLGVVYIALFYSYSFFVFKTEPSRRTGLRFVTFLLIFWFVNNGFFWAAYHLLHISYPIVIGLNFIILGGVRFLIQRHVVFARSSVPSTQTGLSFDVELWYESGWVRALAKTTEDDGDFRGSVSSILATLKSHGHHATFFLTALVVERYPDVVKDISRAGHEVGVHGVAHVRLHQVTDHARFCSELAALCATIEQLTGKRPKGFRAPHFSLDQSTRWLLPILAELGFIYDSSIFPVRTPEYGITAAPMTPYRISFDDVVKEDPNSSLLEIPVAAASVLGLRIPAAGGIYFRLLPLPLFIALVGYAPAPAVLYLHPHELSSATPRVKGPLIKTTLKYWGTRTAMQKFERLCGRFRFDTLEHLFSPHPPADDRSV